MKLAHLPLRVATGAYILNSGLNKTGLEGQAAEGVHRMATNAIPPLKKIPPEQFARILSTGEIALGAALLIPFVPSALVGVALAGFSAGLVQLYLKTPGMRQEGLGHVCRKLSRASEISRLHSSGRPPASMQ